MLPLCLSLYLLLHQIWVADPLTHQLSNSVALFHWKEEEKEMKQFVHCICIPWMFVKALHIFIIDFIYSLCEALPDICTGCQALNKC